MHNEFYAKIPPTALLNGIGSKTLGNTAHLLVSLLESLACFTTAVGIVAGCSYFGLWITFENSSNSSDAKNQNPGTPLISMYSVIPVNDMGI